MEAGVGGWWGWGGGGRALGGRVVFVCVAVLSVLFYC